MGPGKSVPHSKSPTYLENTLCCTIRRTWFRLQLSFFKSWSQKSVHFELDFPGVNI